MRTLHCYPNPCAIGDTRLRSKTLRQAGQCMSNPCRPPIHRDVGKSGFDRDDTPVSAEGHLEVGIPRDLLLAPTQPISATCDISIAASVDEPTYRIYH